MILRVKFSIDILYASTERSDGWVRYLLFCDVECDVHRRQVYGRHPETQPLPFAYLVAVNAMVLLFLLSDVKLVRQVVDLGRP